MNYRGVVVRGTAGGSTTPTSTWPPCASSATTSCRRGRPAAAPSEAEIRQTMVIAVPLVEMSAKIRTGDPIDEPADLDGPHWARPRADPHRLGGAGRRSADLGRGSRRPGGDRRAWRVARCDPPQPGRPVGRPARRPARGLFTGNRGCLVDDDGAIVRHHRSTTLWITCVTSFRGWRHPLDAPHVLDAAVLPRRGRRPRRRAPPVRLLPARRLPGLPRGGGRRVAGHRWPPSSTAGSPASGCGAGGASPVPPTACCGRPTSTTLPDGTVIVDAERRPSLLVGGVDAVVHVRRLGRAGAATPRRRRRRC